MEDRELAEGPSRTTALPGAKKFCRTGVPPVLLDNERRRALWSRLKTPRANDACATIFWRRDGWRREWKRVAAHELKKIPGVRSWRVGIGKMFEGKTRVAQCRLCGSVLIVMRSCSILINRDVFDRTKASVDA